MNTYTNAIHPKKKAHRAARNHRFNKVAILTVVLALVIVAAIAVNTSNRPAVVAENNPAVSYGNSLEMQYAQPWLDAQNNSIESYGNALELQYAQPWLDAQNDSIASYGNALELQYAQPWLQEKNLSIAIPGVEMPFDCNSSLEALYACKSGYGLP